MPSGAELLPRPPQGDASRRPREPRTPTSAPRAQLLHGARTCGAGVARGAQPGWRLEPLRPAEMTWRLWLWCFCAWVAAGWPPGSALQLRPGMPNVCEEEQLTVVGLRQPCVQAFTHTIKIWKQRCTSPRWCVGYERRTRYYTIYRQAYSLEQQTVYKCCPGCSRWDKEPGCLCSVSEVGTCVHGKRCSEGEVQRCQCWEGFQGPHCQYDINECSADNGGCQDQCCNTIGSYYCKCQAGQKLEEDGRGCRDVDECAVLNGGCQQRCINTLGTFHCECDTGYRLHADERTCIKMDPCTGGNGCAHICQSENGMARCACHPGYQLSEDKKACADSSGFSWGFPGGSAVQNIHVPMQAMWVQSLVEKIP